MTRIARNKLSLREVIIGRLGGEIIAESIAYGFDEYGVFSTQLGAKFRKWYSRILGKYKIFCVNGFSALSVLDEYRKEYVKFIPKFVAYAPLIMLLPRFS